MIYKKLTLFQENKDGFSCYIQILVNRKGLVCGNSNIGISSQKENMKKFQKLRRKEESERTTKWAKENPDKIRVYQDKYRFNNLEKRREQDRRSKKKTYPTHKVQQLARNAYRRNEMGFKSLNASIDGIECDGHHIDKEYVIYIPRVIHNAIFHNLKTGKNMKLINSIAEGFK